MPKQSRKGKPEPASTAICLQIVGRERYGQLESIVKRRFRRRTLLAQAAVHCSCHVEVDDHVFVQSNERLEHLGDKVLGLAVAKYLHATCPDKSEHFISQIFYTAVSNKMLADVAQSIGLGEVIVLNKTSGAMRTSTARQNVLADAMEAVIGAIFTDGGLRASESFLERVLYPRVDELVAKGLPKLTKKTGTDAPSRISVSEGSFSARKRLMQLLHKAGKGSPRYEETTNAGDASAPVHIRVFAMATGELLGEGDGVIKRDAMEVAAAAALQKLNP